MALDALLSKMVARGLLDEPAATRAQAVWKDGRVLDDALAELCSADEPTRLKFLADEFDLPLADLDRQPPDKALVEKYPARLLVQHRLLPWREVNGHLSVATSRPFDAAGLDELRMVSGKDIALALAPAQDIDRLLKQLIGVGADTIQSMESDRANQGIEVIDAMPGDDLDLESAAEDASIVRFVNQVLGEAVTARATDVHFEPFENELRVRYRIDGVLVEANIPPGVARFRAAIVSRLKILSHLDIAEKRLPQDGRIRLKIAGREIDVRVSVIPMLHGEAVVLRILDRGATLLGIEHLGMSERDHRLFSRVLNLPHGICLVTGPTGSGKTTSLYAGLSQINTTDLKIVTIEDPIEYQLRGVNQIQVSEKTGLTFATGLRAILRHDPDVVLVGEIRDRETASIAVQASLTGHLVFSTLHTNDAPGALTRLVDMGIEPFLVASSLELVIAQRLVRLICSSCKRAMPVDDVTRLRGELNIDLPDKLYVGEGCRECQGTGYRGRAGIFEMMPVTDTIQRLLLERASSNQIRKAAMREGMRGLREDGWRLILEGRTTLEEVLRVTKDEAAADMRGPVVQEEA
ncbi:MAG: type II/IV secretion system protein [Planctomycetes bacterium]|nr:type II/IV secretion system protein [Planctomycetota bacterium]